MRHDPERAAAAYLAGELGPRQRERFEAHMLACDDCWREVTAGRQGLALAESLREVAPQHLRERIRATIAAAPPPRRRRLRVRMPALLGITAALVALVVAGGLLAVRARAPAQPAAITAAVASYRTGASAWTPTTQPPPARQLGDLTWRGSGQGELAGLPVVAHTYQDPTGRSVVLLQAVRSFPQAHGASHQPPAPPGPPRSRGWRCSAPTTRHPPCSWGTTSPWCWPPRNASACTEVAGPLGPPAVPPGRHAWLRLCRLSPAGSRMRTLR
jgi:Putative zinc-finger